MSATLPSRPGESLHSLSWVFVLLAQLWNLFPLLFTIVLAGRLGKNDNWELAATLVAAVALSAYSMFYSYTFRFWVEDDEIIVKEGLFDRTLRHVPFNRIQNVAFRQNLLHRIFQVVELNLESGAGAKPEAKLTVLPQARARLLEQQIRRQRVSELAIAESSLPHTHADRESGVVELHRVPLRDLVRLGLISNRGMLLIGAAFYFLNQTKLFPTNMFKQIGLVVKDWIGVAHGPGFWIASGALSFILLLAVVRAASVAHAIFSFNDFRLYSEAGRLKVEHGLLTRHGGSTQADRIVCFVLRDGWLYRWFNRQSAEVVLAGSISGDTNGQSASGMRFLSPVATPEIAEHLIATASGLSLSRVNWQPLHKRAWRRMLKWPLIIIGVQVAVLAVISFWFWRGQGVLVLALLYVAFAAWMSYACKRNARASGFALTPSELVIRSGYLTQTTLVVPRREVQSVALSQSPFDRQHQMATVHIDLRAGTVLEMPEAAVHYLPENVASALARVLRRPSSHEQNRRES